MSQLDDRLREIIHEAYEVGFDNGEGSREPLHDEFKIEAIKIAFTNAGYVQQLPKVEDGTLYPLVWAKANGYKTGAEWYARFEEELDKLVNAEGYYHKYRASGVHGYYNEYWLEAAKHASGLSEDKE